MGLFDRILGKGKSAATATPVKTSKSEPLIKPHGADPTLPAGPGASGGLPGATVPVVAATEKKGLLRIEHGGITVLDTERLARYGA